MPRPQRFFRARPALASCQISLFRLHVLDVPYDMQVADSEHERHTNNGLVYSYDACACHLVYDTVLLLISRMQTTKLIILASRPTHQAYICVPRQHAPRMHHACLCLSRLACPNTGRSSICKMHINHMPRDEHASAHPIDAEP